MLKLPMLILMLAGKLAFNGVCGLANSDPECERLHTPAQIRWAYIVMGESGGRWMTGSRLIAWTLRAWEVYRGMPAIEAGKEWGWFGWQEPNAEAWQAVYEAWKQPPEKAPFRFMRQGKHCYALGSNADVSLWITHYGYSTPNVSIWNPIYPAFGMHCYFPN